MALQDHPLQKLVFTKGMNYDDSPEKLQEGEARRRVDVRVLSSDNDENEAVEIPLGNTLVSFTLPTGTNKVIGAKEYKKINKIFYIVWNSTKKHLLLQYDISANTVTKVMDEATSAPYRWNFDKDHLITGMFFEELDKDNHLWYFTDDYVDPNDPDIYNEGKKINIEKGIAHCAGDYVTGYPATIDPEFFFQIKQPMLCCPDTEYDDDPTKEINYLENKLFQFKVQFFYDDKDISSWGPISRTCYPKSICGEVVNEKQNNVINVTVDTGIEIVTRIRISAKECNEPDFKLVADLNKADLEIPSNSTYVFKFYNDSNYLPLEVLESAKLFDFVPLHHKADESIEGDRGTKGNITEGFDPVEADLKLNLRLEEAIDAPTYSIKGLIYIPNLCTEVVNTGFNKYQPIYSGDGTGGGPVFGGIHEYLVGGHVENMGDYQQKLPLGGFFCYLVGTNHSGVSTQNNTGGLPVDGSYPGRNVYTITSYTDRNDVRSEMKSANVYSQFEISGVPPGKYILRMSPTSDVRNSVMTAGVGGWEMNECVLQVLGNGDVYIESIGTFAAGSNIPDTYILDLTSGNSKNDASTHPQKARFMVLDGYLTDDSDLGSIELANVQMFRDAHGQPSDEAAEGVFMTSFLVNPWGVGFIDTRISEILNRKSTTDHNGYYACPSLVGYWDPTGFSPSQCITGCSLEITDIQVKGATIPMTLTGTGPDCWQGSTILIAATVPSTSKSELRGTILYQGVPLAGAIAANQRGDYGITDANGVWRIVVYPYTGVSTRADRVLYYLDGSCIGYFDPGTNEESYNVTFGADPDYNDANFYYMQDVNLLNILGTDPINSLKRGGVYDYGIIYYDHGNRSGLTNINDGPFDEILANGRYGTKLFVPFYTQQKTVTDPAAITFTMAVSILVHQAVNGGSGYTNPSVTFSGGAGSPQATASATMRVGFITVTAPGAGYTVAPTVIFSSGSATGVAVLGTNIGVDDDQVVEILVTDPGAGYTTVPTISFSGGGGGAGAAATADMEIDEVTILTTGAGYTSFPTLTINDPTGVGATCNFSMFVDALILGSGGSGYTVAPIIVFEGGGSPTSDAVGSTTILFGSVATVTVDSGGAGYASFPTLTVFGGDLWLGAWPQVDWEVYNEPPKWATHWQFARVKNAANDRYIQFVADTVEYLNASGVVVGFGGSPTQVRIGTLNITDAFRKTHPDSILAYDFVIGDRIRWIKRSNGSFYAGYFDEKITGWNSGTLKATFDIDNSQPEIMEGDQFEIYFPKLSLPTDQKITFEIGVCNDIAVDAQGRPYHKGETGDQIIWHFDDNIFYPHTGGTLGFYSTLPHNLSIGDKIKVTQDLGFTNAEYNTYFTVNAIFSSTQIGVDGTFGISTPAQGGTIVKCATGNFYSGDTFYRFRAMPYNNNPATTKLDMIEDANFSDFFASKAYDYGRPNRVDPTYRRITRPTTIYYTEKFIPETNINGLSTIYDSSFRSYEAKYGSIQLLYSENNRLIMFQELKVSQIPVQQIIYNDLSGQTAVGASEYILSSQPVPYLGEFGIGKNPESFSVYGQAKYFIDVKRGAFLRLSLDGITAISINARMHNWFTDKCQQIVQSGQQVKIYGGFDIKFKEAILAFETYTYVDYNLPTPASVTVLGETIAFNEQDNFFSTFYSYEPDFMAGSGNDLVSFKAGSLWKHNDPSAIYANFYGVQYRPLVQAMFNVFPSNQKVIQAIAQESDSPWEVNMITPSGQETVLKASNFVLREGYMYAEFKRDLNTPNVTNPIAEGRVMRGQTALITLTYPLNNYNKLYAANILFVASNRSNK